VQDNSTLFQLTWLLYSIKWRAWL